MDVESVATNRKDKDSVLSIKTELSGGCFYPRLISFLGVLTVSALMAKARVQSKGKPKSAAIV